MQTYILWAIVLTVMIGLLTDIYIHLFPSELQSYKWLLWPFLALLVIALLIATIWQRHTSHTVPTDKASTDRIDKMKLKIKIGTASGFVLYVTMFAYLISPDWLLKNVTIFRALGWSLGIAMAGYLVIGDVHNWLDQSLFSEREKVDTYIRERLTSPCREILCLRAVKRGIVHNEKATIMHLFYTFIPSDDTERELAFSNFTEYFITVNLSVLAFLGMAGGMITPIFVPLAQPGQVITYVLLVLIFPLLLNGLRLRTRRKLVYPAEAQCTKILSQDLKKLRSLLPTYRNFEDDTSCRNSGKCPFLAETGIAS